MVGAAEGLFDQLADVVVVKVVLDVATLTRSCDEALVTQVNRPQVFVAAGLGPACRVSAGHPVAVPTSVGTHSPGLLVHHSAGLHPVAWPGFGGVG